MIFIFLYCTSIHTQVISAVRPKQVMVLTTANIYEYITADPGAIMLPYARCLRTSRFKQSIDIPLLEPPNFIKGEAAACK